MTLYLQTPSGTISWQTAANWSTLTTPTTGDVVYAANSSAAIATGLLNTATLASLFIPQTFTGSIGLASQAVQSMTAVSSSTTATATCTAHGYSTGDVVIISGAVESAYNGTFTITVTTANAFTYTMGSDPADTATGTIIVRKNHNLIQPVTALQIGAPANGGVQANGAGRVALDLGTVQSTVSILATGQSGADSGLEPVRLIGSHASNALNMGGGAVGLATTLVSETATFATINQTGGTLNGGPGLTWSTIYQSGGNLNLASGAAAGSLTQARGANARLTGAGTVANLTIGGTLFLDIRKASAGDTVTGTLQLDDGAVLDLSGNPATLSVTTLKINGKAKIIRNKANPAHFSWTTLTQQAGSQLSLE